MNPHHPYRETLGHKSFAMGVKLPGEARRLGSALLRADQAALLVHHHFLAARETQEQVYHAVPLPTVGSGRRNRHLCMPRGIGIAGLDPASRAVAHRHEISGPGEVQKLLIVGERTRQDRRAKDMAYLYQVASFFRRELPALAGEVRARMEGPAAWCTWLGRARRQAEVHFATPAAPGVTAAHRVLAAELAGQGVEVPSPAMIHAGVRLFLNGL